MIKQTILALSLALTPALASASELLKVGTPVFDGKYVDIPVIIDTKAVRYVQCALLGGDGFPLGTSKIVADNQYDMVTVKLSSVKQAELVKGVNCSYILR